MRRGRGEAELRGKEKSVPYSACAFQSFPSTSLWRSLCTTRLAKAERARRSTRRRRTPTRVTPAAPLREIQPQFSETIKSKQERERAEEEQPRATTPSAEPIRSHSLHTFARPMDRPYSHTDPSPPRTGEWGTPTHRRSTRSDWTVASSVSTRGGAGRAGEVVRATDVKPVLSTLKQEVLPVRHKPFALPQCPR